MMKNLGLIVMLFAQIAAGNERESLLLRGRVPSSIDYNLNESDFLSTKQLKAKIKTNFGMQKLTIREISENNNQYLEIIFN